MRNIMIKNKGFTLIELMITVAIIGILAAIAYPSYQEHVLKTRRALAQGCILELAQYMERYYTTNMTFVGAVPPNTSCVSDLAGKYNFTSGGIAATTYTLTAAPLSPQDQDLCKTMTINELGVKTTTGAAGCW